MRIYLYLCLLLLSFASSANNSLSVYLAQEKVQLKFDKAVRLEAVLKEAQQHSSLGGYPLGSILSNNEHQVNLDNQKREILEQLRLLSLYSPLLSWQEVPYRKEANLISNQLTKMSFASRLFIPLDYDLIRIKKELNPLLTGDFSLWVNSRPENITVFGVITSLTSVQLPYRQAGTIEHYLEQLDVDSIANTSQIYVIQPDGVVQIATNNYWQNNTTSLAPGATVFVGFSDLPNQFSTLNDDIVELLRNKVN